MRENLKYVSVAGAVLMGISLGLPWSRMTVSCNNLPAINEYLVYGWNGGGFLFMGYAVLLSLLAFIRRPWSFFPAILALSLVLSRYYDFWSGGMLKNIMKSDSSPQFGFYVALIGAIISVIASLPGRGKMQAEEKGKDVPVV